MLKAFVLAATGIPVVISCILLLLIGSKGLYALIFTLFGPGFGIMYGLVGKYAARILNEVSENKGKAIPALIVRDVMQSPGVIVLGESSLILVSIVGKRTEISRSQLTSFRQVCWFNGQLLIGKTGFYLSVPDYRRLACAVPKSFADDFRSWLCVAEKKQ